MNDKPGTDSYLSDMIKAYEATRKGLLALPHSKRNLILQTQSALETLRGVVLAAIEEERASRR